MIIGIDAGRAMIARRTGTEAYAYHLIRTLIPLTAAHTLKLYVNTRSDERVFPPAAHVEIVHIPFPRLWTHVRLAAELHRRPPDVFFTPAHVIPFTYFGAGVATIHDLGYYHFPQAHTWWQRQQLVWATRHNGRRARRVIADSVATKRDLVEIDGIPADKIDVIYPGLDPDLEPTGHRPTLAPAAPYLLFLSTIQPRKNVARIVDAFAAAADHIPHHLVLAGRMGWRSQPIQARIDNLPPAVRQRIHQPGFVPDDQKADLIAQADLFLYPSLYEGFGFPLLEANRCGTAVIAADTSSLPELAHADGQPPAARLVNPADVDQIAAAIRELIDNPAERQNLITAGKKNATRFSWQKTGPQVLDVLLRAAA